MKNNLTAFLDRCWPHLVLLVAILLTTLAITCSADEIQSTAAPKSLPLPAAMLVAKADADIAKVRKSLVDALTKAQADETRKGSLDGALAIKAKIEELSRDLPTKAVATAVEPHSSRDVILYAEDNFGGQGTVVRAFNAVTEVYTIGFPNDGLRSIKVPAGVTVVVYEGNLGGGASQEITHDMPTLQGVAALGMTSFKILHTPTP